jgi:hypothetical protein
MRLRNPGTIDQAIQAVNSLRSYLSSARGGGTVLPIEDPFLTWIDDQARPQFESLFAPTEDLLAELEVSHNRINNAPKSNVRRLNAMLSRELMAWDRRLGDLIVELSGQKRIAGRPGEPIVLDTSVLMEGQPLMSFDWHSLDPSLVSKPVRLVVPILVVEELDDLLHDRQAERRQKARTATRTLLELHETRPTEPAVLPGQPDVTIEVLLDGDWHERRPNNDAEIIDQALAFHELTGKPVLLATCDLRMMYRAGAVSLTAVQVPRAH